MPSGCWFFSMSSIIWFQHIFSGFDTSTPPPEVAKCRESLSTAQCQKLECMLLTWFGLCCDKLFSGGPACCWNTNMTEKKFCFQLNFFWETLKRAKFRNAFVILLGNCAGINFKIYYLNKIMQTILPQKCYTDIYSTFLA